MKSLILEDTNQITRILHSAFSISEIDTIHKHNITLDWTIHAMQYWTRRKKDS